jgi:cobalt-zinc-cadmium efflux system outer membrane protein
MNRANLAAALLPATLLVAACRSDGQEPRAAAPLDPRQATSPAPVSDPAAPAPATVVSGPTIELVSLEAALTLAWGNRHEIAAARAAWNAAGARRDGAGLLPNPSAVVRVEEVSLEGNARDDAVLLAGFTQGIPLSGRRAAARRLEDAGAARERARLEAEIARIGAEVRGAFATALFADEALRLRARFAEESDAAAALVRARVAAGDATEDEVARAELDSARARQESAGTRRARDAALAALAAAMGLPTATIERLEGDLGATLALPDLERLASELERHPALRVAEADVASARAALELAHELRAPDLNVDLLYRFIGATDTNAVDVGLSLPLPLFDGGAARVREAESGVDAARERAVAARSDLLGALRRSHAKLAAALEAGRFLRDEVLPRQARLVAIEEARHAAGDSGIAALLHARRERLAAEIVALEADRAAHEAWAELRSLTEPGVAALARDAWSSGS